MIPRCQSKVQAFRVPLGIVCWVARLGVAVTGSPRDLEKSDKAPPHVGPVLQRPSVLQTVSMADTEAPEERLPTSALQNLIDSHR
jgi:hypothetical protein